ncbi:phosphoribosyl 1,2-cyclic phosphate phosphodiesterase [Chitinophaga terrae (ex Kim and Jung 2007)]|uniref:Phosphoribosyl 1,2-cyclic phosphate phosphodiesterase n=1 Tax=Chitinophaga terrae (ex Kim and Jung 2007) TaxID=408074 RepID=A0A1H3Y6V3_9BACT|nr:MBL fold metallo-hydrolase [Chitinophaga terrae (ex Kim and Jung 2007)]MDQ0107972.1 phosphoribosyl 1,2-cyclic phosphate phosphodiesterase [Chitinophaga terrae (ex Kim and Jung 2007)]GEP90901.1 hydrolase [Chitinophaga terrae (ex Kim and Jung 2007)]SEA07355.1 phosphoribosyl 1,2-cyclic phosphate phosphodiesterase [Chitinophaga terrae (ex Kim and Jung 2007)]
MKVTFLGTGTSQGVPVIACGCEVCTSTDKKDKRLRSSIMVSSPAGNIVVDTTPDFRYQMLREKVGHLEAVLITHSHKDHIAGMDDIRAFNYFQKSAINIYASEFSQEVIKREFAYAFTEYKYPGIPEINLQTIPDTPFDVNGLQVTPIHVLHHQMPVLGFRFHDFTYITDANFIAPEEKEKIRGSKILVLNALRREKHISHFTLGEAIELGRELEVPEVYFTHISHQLGLHAEVSKELPEGMALAYDGLTLEI